MLTKGITSGLVGQIKYQNDYFPSTHTKSNSVLTRPYVDSFDTGVKKVSNPHEIENGRPKFTIPNSVGYKKIFGKGSSPDERMYYLEKGLNRIERAALGRPKGKALKRNRFSKILGQEKQLQNTEDMAAFTFAQQFPGVFELPQSYRIRRRSFQTDTSAPSSETGSMAVSSLGVPLELPSPEREMFEDLAQAMGGTDIAAMDLVQQSPSTPSVEMSPMSGETVLEYFHPPDTIQQSDNSNDTSPSGTTAASSRSYHSARSSFSGPTSFQPPPPPPPPPPPSSSSTATQSTQRSPPPPPPPPPPPSSSSTATQSTQRRRGYGLRDSQTPAQPNHAEELVRRVAESAQRRQQNGTGYLSRINAARAAREYTAGPIQNQLSAALQRIRRSVEENDETNDQDNWS